MEKPIRVLVTGATGCVGSFLVENLLDEGWKVRALVRPSSDRRWLPADRLEIVEGTLDDPSCLSRALAGVEYVFHLAGFHNADSLEAFRALHVKPVALMLEALAGSPSLRRFVLLSCYSAAGPSPDGRPLTEASPARPATRCGISKLEAEELVRAHSDQVPSTVVRASAVYGPRDRRFLPVFKQASHGLVPKIGLEERYADLIFVHDLADGLRRVALEPSAAGQLYYMAHPVRTGNASFVQSVGKAFGRRVFRLPLPKVAFDLALALVRLKARRGGGSEVVYEERLATMRHRYWIADSTKLTRTLHWSPPTRLEEGLRRTLAWYRREGWL